MLLTQAKRYYNAARIFRFFLHTLYIYPSIFRDLFEKSFISTPFVSPRNLVLKLDEICNARCDFCYAEEEKRKQRPQMLSLDEWKHVVDEARELGCYTVTLSGGEPLIYPHLVDLVSYIQSKRMMPVTTTNGLAATPDLVRELEKAGLAALNFSLHGPRHYQDTLLKVDGAFDALVEHGSWTAQNTKMIAIVNHVVTRESITHKWYDYVWELMAPKGFRALNLLPICINNDSADNLLTAEDLKIFDRLAARPYVLMDTKNYSAPMCPAAREDFLVNSYGDVQPCPFIPIAFGNVREVSVRELYIKMQRHSMFAEHRSICMPARDHQFIEKYLKPAFKSEKVPPDIEEIVKE